MMRELGGHRLNPAGGMAALPGYGPGIVGGSSRICRQPIASRTYEATAVVIVAQPRYQMQFDPRFETVQQWTPAYKAFPTA